MKQSQFAQPAGVTPTVAGVPVFASQLVMCMEQWLCLKSVQSYLVLNIKRQTRRLRCAPNSRDAGL